MNIAILMTEQVRQRLLGKTFGAAEMTRSTASQCGGACFKVPQVIER